MTIISQQNDSVDAICFRHYGGSSMVEKVLEANPGLAARGTILPIGLTLTLPAPDQAKGPDRAEKKTIKLWD
ncbi:tail protein X [Kiloniella laminariae]|uniref:Tail protein X n=1 Tax=Kiloniella laminariae TaxID=454162 RepID=A0ABT4LKS7_9PROT|nr:tail protein X [Kiloniella laminariae]MCZ4281713.1 tail protein X [Kiloniella laminariae]